MLLVLCSFQCSCCFFSKLWLLYRIHLPWNRYTGAYGFVVSALDTCTGNRVAIKQVKPLNHQTFCQRTLREIIILSQLKHDNIVRLLDIIVSDEKPLSEVYLVLNLMETDLHKLLKNLRHQKEYLTESHTCFFLYQMFLGIKFIHSANVLHR